METLCSVVRLTERSSIKEILSDTDIEEKTGNFASIVNVDEYKKNSEMAADLVQLAFDKASTHVAIYDEFRYNK